MRFPLREIVGPELNARPVQETVKVRVCSSSSVPGPADMPLKMWANGSPDAPLSKAASSKLDTVTLLSKKKTGL